MKPVKTPPSEFPNLKGKRVSSAGFLPKIGEAGDGSLSLSWSPGCCSPLSLLGWAAPPCPGAASVRAIKCDAWGSRAGEPPAMALFMNLVWVVREEPTASVQTPPPGAMTQEKGAWTLVIHICFV